MGSGFIFPLILNIGLSTLRRGRSTRRERSQHALNRRLVDPQSRSGHFEVEKNPLPLPSPLNNLSIMESDDATWDKIVSRTISLCYSNTSHFCEKNTHILVPLSAIFQINML